MSNTGAGKLNRVLLGVGSNVEPEKHLRLGFKALVELDADLIISPVYQSAALGFEGDDFLNAVVMLHTQLSVLQLQQWIAKIEKQCGRIDGEPRFSPKCLDIDLLLFNQEVGLIDGVVLPRYEVLESAFVLKPLADIYAEGVHPELKTRFDELWRAFEQDNMQQAQSLSLITFN